jgi:hypothetical protein
VAKTLLFLGEEGQKYALPSIFTDGYSLVSGDIFVCEDDALADTLLLETGRGGALIFEETSDPATVFPPLVVVPPIGGGFSAEAEQLSEEVVSINSKAESGTDFVSYRSVAALTPYEDYNYPVAFHELSASETDIQGTGMDTTGRSTESVGRGLYQKATEVGQTMPDGGLVFGSELTSVTFGYTHEAEYTYSHPIDFPNGCTGLWTISLSPADASSMYLESNFGGGTMMGSIARSYYNGIFEVVTGAYQREESGVAMVSSFVKLYAENDSDSVTISIGAGALDSDGQTDNRQAYLVFENADRIQLIGLPKSNGSETPTFGSTAPVAGLEIVDWVTLVVDGQPRYLPLFGVPS